VRQPSPDHAFLPASHHTHAPITGHCSSTCSSFLPLHVTRAIAGSTASPALPHWTLTSRGSPRRHLICRIEAAGLWTFAPDGITSVMLMGADRFLTLMGVEVQASRTLTATVALEAGKAWDWASHACLGRGQYDMSNRGPQDETPVKAAGGRSKDEAWSEATDFKAAPGRGLPAIRPAEVQVSDGMCTPRYAGRGRRRSKNPGLLTDGVAGA
jgi:hypothetical protein